MRQTVISISLYPSQIKKIDLLAASIPTEVERGNLRSAAIRHIIDKYQFSNNNKSIGKRVKNVK